MHVPTSPQAHLGPWNQDVTIRFRQRHRSHAKGPSQLNDRQTQLAAARLAEGLLDSGRLREAGSGKDVDEGWEGQRRREVGWFDAKLRVGGRVEHCPRSRLIAVILVVCYAAYMRHRLVGAHHGQAKGALRIVRDVPPSGADRAAEVCVGRLLLGGVVSHALAGSPLRLRARRLAKDLDARRGVVVAKRTRLAERVPPLLNVGPHLRVGGSTLRRAVALPRERLAHLIQLRFFRLAAPAILPRVFDGSFAGLPAVVAPYLLARRVATVRLDVRRVLSWSALVRERKQLLGLGDGCLHLARFPKASLQELRRDGVPANVRRAQRLALPRQVGRLAPLLRPLEQLRLWCDIHHSGDRVPGVTSRGPSKRP
mmetsp:Transcript_10495/g.31366  ORF Transcript_10495/g.31366 Transcript_10495/m.31366 type:complete len:368 (+) Transcript_10495:47-1150(+)